MDSMMDLWVPVLVSSVVIFIVSGVSHMALKFWHRADDQGFSNEDDVAAAVRKGTRGAGMYMLPYCTPENANSPEMKQKLADGPVGVLFLRAPGSAGLGSSLAQWFVFILVVSLLTAYVAANVLSATVSTMEVLRLVAVITFMAYSLAPFSYGIWFGQPWRSVIKHAVDGVVFGLIAGAVFAWLWPMAG